MLKAMFIFRGLTKPPKMKRQFKDIYVTASKSGSMDHTLAKDWLDRVFSNRGAHFSNTPSLLLWDSYGSHSKDDVKAHLKTKNRSEKKTSYAQPLDVGINSPFKNDLKKSWADWFKNSVPVYTNAGNRKHYETMVEMVVDAMKAVSPEVICSSFKVCGIAPYGQDVPQEELDQRLRMVMSFTPNELISNDDDERIIVDDDQDHDSSCDDDDYEMSEDANKRK